MGMVAFLFSGVDLFDRRLHVKSGENWSRSFREDVQRLDDFKHVLLPRVKGKKLPGDRVLIVTKTFYYFNHTLKISAISLKNIFRKRFFNIFQTSIRMQSWSCHRKVKGHSRSITWTNLVDLEFPMLYTNIQPRSFFGSGEDDFYHILAWRPPCWMMQNRLNKLIIPIWQKAQCEIWWKLVNVFQSRRRLKIIRFYTCM